jgi:periplasmic protein TonB
MSAELANTVWSATLLAQDEPTVKASALSVRQRKLLALLNTPMSVDGLSSLSGLPHPEIETNLARFAKLGLAQARSDAAAPAEFRSSSFATTTPASNRMPLVVGGIALTAVAVAIWWFTRAPSGAAPAAPSASQASQSAAPVPLVSPSDVSTTNVFVPGAPVAPTAPATANDAAKLAAAAKEREVAARDAAKNAKQTPTSTPPPTVATSAPAPTPAVSAAPTPAPAPTITAATPPAPPPPTVATPATAAPPAAAPATQVAAAPAPAPAQRPAAPAAPREGALVSRVEPSFPRNAEVDRGTVRARLTVNGTGAVTGVDIVEANPPRVFDRNVRTALLQWRYEGTGETQTKLVEVQFNR